MAKTTVEIVAKPIGSTNNIAFDLRTSGSAFVVLNALFENRYIRSAAHEDLRNFIPAVSGGHQFVTVFDKSENKNTHYYDAELLNYKKNYASLTNTNTYYGYLQINRPTTISESEIYAVRVYNRVLSDYEIYVNKIFNKSRFGI